MSFNSNTNKQSPIGANSVQLTHLLTVSDVAHQSVMLFLQLGHAVVLSALAVALLHPDLTDSVMPSNSVVLSSTLTPVLSGGIPDGDDHQNPLLYYSRTIDRGMKTFSSLLLYIRC